MKILHYSLGFPPYRTGGLTKFCMDLMKEQVIEGHEVSLLWPGEMKFISHGIRIKNRHPVDGIKSFEVINPLPVPFDEGIKDFDVFMQDGDKGVYERFLSDLQPDVIHVHTLMGLHKNLLIAAKEKSIRLVFTTHDFFPICPKVTMFRHGKICESIESCEECGVCNNTALSLKKIQILQSPFYRVLKDSTLVKKFRKQHRDKYLGDDTERDENRSVGTVTEYKNLRLYYQEMLSLMNIVHYNSSVTKDAYERVFGILDSCTLTITHSNIGDHRKIKEFNDRVIRIRYLGPQGEGKGYYILKEALDEVWRVRQDFCLDIHFVPQEVTPYIRIHDRYRYEELEKIFNATDVLVVPSIWYETFGYTVLEALSFGVPSIISDTVGAKDILEENTGIVLSNINADQLSQVIRDLNRKKLEDMNSSIYNYQSIQKIADLEKELETSLYSFR